MTTFHSPKVGTQVWEDDGSADPRFRRVQQASPPTGRTLPGMPLEMPDADEDDAPRRRHRYDAPSGAWWRPASAAGRVFLTLGALVMLGGLITSYILIRHSLERDGRFRIEGTENIQATGLSQVSRAEMLPVFGEDIGKNIFFIHLNDRRRQLEQIPWIEKATVMRILPDRIRVAVEERTPVAFVRDGQQIGLVDANGVLLTMAPASMTAHHFSFPVVTGIDGRDPLPSRHGRMAVYQRLIGDLDSTGQHLSEQISEIDLTDPEDARVLMPEQGADILAHFGDEQFLSRYQRYKAHIAEWRQQYPRLSAVDLRYDTQVVLEMAPGAGSGTGSAQTAVNASDGKPVAVAEAPVAEAGAAPAKPSAGVPAGAQADEAAKAGHQGKAQAKPSRTAQMRPASRIAKEKRKRAAALPRRPASAQAERPSLRPMAGTREGQ